MKSKLIGIVVLFSCAAGNIWGNWATDCNRLTNGDHILQVAMTITVFNCGLVAVRAPTLRQKLYWIVGGAVIAGICYLGYTTMHQNRQECLLRAGH